MNPIENIPDFVFDALSASELQQSEELQQWLAENQTNKALFKELLAYCEAERRLLPETTPDIELQWKRVKQRNLQKCSTKRFVYYRKAICIAASLLLVLSISLFLQETPKQNFENIETQISLVDISGKPETTVVTQSKKESPTILLSTEKGKTTIVRTQILDYTQRENLPSATDIKTELLTLTTPRGKSIKILLDDSTEVWLNAESRLTYPSRFTDSTRTVHLKGEAYFKVAHNPQRPFIVKHHTTTTRALGTEFNVRAYADDIKHVTLIEGKVLVKDTLSLQQEILLPGEDAEYDSSTSITKKEVNPREFTAWTEDLFYFEQTNLLSLMQILGRWYNTTIIFKDEDIKHYRFTFWAKRSENLKSTLEMLNQIGTVKVRLNTQTNQVFISKR